MVGCSMLYHYLAHMDGKKWRNIRGQKGVHGGYEEEDLVPELPVPQSWVVEKGPGP